VLNIKTFLKIKIIPEESGYIMKSYAVEICHRLHDLLDGEEKIQGNIHSVFNRVCNLTIKDWPIISLIFDSMPMKPMSISFRATDICSLHDLEMERGQVVLYQGGKFEIPQCGFSLILKDAKTLDCRSLFNFKKGNENDITSNISELRNILSQGNNLGLLPVICDFEESIGEPKDIIIKNNYSQFAWPRTSNLIKAIEQGELSEITKASSKLAGFGPGLTPSSDDMLIGLMISLIYASNYYRWGDEYIKSINSAILKGAAGKTTQLSYEMMCFAAQGEVTKNIHGLMSNIYSNSSQLLHKNAMDVMNYGETSGSDMLTGIYIGCKISSISRRKK
jgi:glutaredoxin-related protein